MFRRKPDPTKVDIKLFYEFAKTMIEDVDSLQTDIKRLKKQIGAKR